MYKSRLNRFNTQDAFIKSVKLMVFMKLAAINQIPNGFVMGV